MDERKWLIYQKNKGALNLSTRHILSLWITMWITLEKETYVLWKVLKNGQFQAFFSLWIKCENIVNSLKTYGGFAAKTL